jgi:hypothetical protein
LTFARGIDALKAEKLSTSYKIENAQREIRQDGPFAASTLTMEESTEKGIGEPA